jgi:hypothetical protein
VAVRHRDQVYPFRPGSTRVLRLGQFWALPLRGSGYGCGRVLDLPESGVPDRPGQRTLFVAGLLDWTDTAPPTTDSIAGAGLVDFGQVHIKTVHETGGVVLGERVLEADGIRVPRWVDARGPGRGVYEGLRRSRPTDSIRRSRPVFHTSLERVTRFAGIALK